MKCTKENNGITLIALIITIIVLLILAAVSIRLIFGDNGIIKRAIQAKEDYNIAKVLEKLELKISNLAIEILEEENRTIKLNDLYRFNNDEDKTVVEAIPNVSDALQVTIDNYTFRVDENMKVSIVLESMDSILATYQIISQSDNNLQIKIEITSNKEILSIDYNQLSNVEINYNESKTQCEIVCDVINENTYKIKIETDKEEKEYELIPSISAKPIIEKSNSYAYPVLSDYGIELNQKIHITYDEDTENYYSLDDGKTWQLYTAPIPIKSNAKVLAKSLNNSKNVIQKEVVENINYELASDAIGEAAYDGTEGTYHDAYNTEASYMDIDSSMIGKKVYISAECNGTNYMSFILEDGSESIILKGVKFSDNVAIPENAKRIKIYGNKNQASYLYEIQPNNVPEIEVKPIYPTIYASGLEKAYNLVTIKYHVTSVQKLYSLDGTTWNNYEENEIKLEIGQTIYAKGIDKDNIESRKTNTYKSVIPSDAIGEKAYDGSTGTYYSANNAGTAYIDIDSSMIGNEVYISADCVGTNYMSFILEDGSENIIFKGIRFAKNVEIPENAKRIKIYCNKSQASYLYEIQVR